MPHRLAGLKPTMIDAALGNEDALDLAQRQVRIARELERVRQDDQVEAGGVERQGVEVAAQRGGGTTAMRASPGSARALACRRSRFGAPSRQLIASRADSTASQRCGMRLARSASSCGQAELQRVEAEQIGDGMVEMALFPVEQVPARRGTAATGATV